MDSPARTHVTSDGSPVPDTPGTVADSAPAEIPASAGAAGPEGPAAGPESPRPGSPARLGRRLTVAVAAAIAVLALVIGFGPGPLDLPGLPSPGPVTYWALPFSRLAGRIAAVGTIGWLLAAAVLIPGRPRTARDTTPAPGAVPTARTPGTAGGTEPAPTPAELSPATEADAEATDAEATDDVGATGTATGVSRPAEPAGGRKGSRPLGPTGRRCGRYAANAAIVWLLATLAELVFTLSDVSARPVGDVLDVAALRSFLSATTQGRALLAVAAAALVVAVIGRTVMTTSAAGALLTVAVIGVVPPILVGHASTAGDHALAVVALGFHVLAASAWVGGLLGVLTAVRLPVASFAPALRRYSRFAAGAAAVTAITGVASAAIRLGGFSPLWSTRYGALVLLKVLGLLIAVTLGGWLRQRVVTGLASPAPGPGAIGPRAIGPGAIGRFTRIAGVEIAVLTATVGLAVGLSRTAPPVDDTIVPGDATQALLGYPMPPPVTAVRLATDWRIDWVFLGACVAAALLYLAALRRLHARGNTWPLGRTIAWLSGLAVVVVGTSSGLGLYGPVLLSVHMSQHMLLSMLAPIPLVLGAPMTLALRALRPAVAPHRTGPREWLLAALRSWPVRVLTHPAFVTVNFVASLYVLYLTSLLSTLMHNHLGHLAMNAHFLVAGFLFFELLIGIDPLPKRLPHVGRIGMLLSVVPFHTFLGLSIMSMSTLLGSGWYDRLVRPWGVNPLTDQRTAGGIVWSFGEIPTFVVLIVLVIQWSRQDDRRTRARERRIATAGVDAELDAYNAYLARLAAGPARRTPAASGARPTEGPTESLPD